MRTQNSMRAKLGWSRRVVKKSGLQYATPEDALKSVKQDYHYWTQRITEYSYSLSIAIIGANWAVFGGAANKLLSNPWSKLSLAFVVLSLGLGLYGAKKLGTCYGDRVDYAEDDYHRWKDEYENTIDVPQSFWPYTQKTIRISDALRLSRVWLPIVGGVFFLIGLLFT